MTQLSVNINKIALIRNSRGRNYPDVAAFSERFLQLGAHGITLHPRPDQRHARYSDAHELKVVCDRYNAELNIEGNPTRGFLDVVLAVKPAQCTLVPDDPNQVTSDHGWDLANNADFLREVCAELNAAGVRVQFVCRLRLSKCRVGERVGRKSRGAIHRAVCRNLRHA